MGLEAAHCLPLVGFIVTLICLLLISVILWALLPLSRVCPSPGAWTNYCVLTLLVFFGAHFIFLLNLWECMCFLAVSLMFFSAPICVALFRHVLLCSNLQSPCSCLTMCFWLPSPAWSPCCSSSTHASLLLPCFFASLYWFPHLHFAFSRHVFLCSPMLLCLTMCFSAPTIFLSPILFPPPTSPVFLFSLPMSCFASPLTFFFHSSYWSNFDPK